MDSDRTSKFIEARWGSHIRVLYKASRTLPEKVMNMRVGTMASLTKEKREGSQKVGIGAHAK